MNIAVLGLGIIGQKTSLLTVIQYVVGTVRLKVFPIFMPLYKKRWIKQR